MHVQRTVTPSETLPFNEWAKYIRQQTLPVIPKPCACGYCDKCIVANLRKNALKYFNK